MSQTIKEGCVWGISCCPTRFQRDVWRLKREAQNLIQRFWNARGKISHPLIQISFKEFKSPLEASGTSWVIPNDSLIQLFQYASSI